MHSSVVDTRCGGATAIVAAMQANTSDVKVQQWGCGALRDIITSGNVCKKAMVGCGGHVAIVAAMKSHPSDAGVQRLGCGALMIITTADKSAVLGCGGHTAVVAAMQAHRSEVMVQQLGCGVLWNIACGDAAYKSAVVGCGGHAAVVAAMEAHPSEVKVQRMGCGALAKITSGDAACIQTVRDCGGSAAVVAAMQAHLSDVEVQRLGCGALRNITYVAVVSWGGHAAVVAAMQAHLSDVEVQRSGCGALMNITRGDIVCVKAMVVGCGGLAAIVAAMQAHPLVVEVQQWGCGALQNIAYADAACKQAVVDCGGHSAVVAAMQAYPSDVEMQQWGCGALRNIAYADVACKQAVVGCGGPAAIVAAMQAHPSDVGVQRWGCGALRNIAYADVACKQAVVGCGGHAAVVAAMQAHPSEVRVQRSGCGVLRNIAYAEAAYKSAVVGCGGHAAVVAAMQAHLSDVEMQRLGCGALANITSGDAACIQAVWDCGGSAAVVAAMQAHPSDVEVDERSCSTLANISIIPVFQEQAVVRSCAMECKGPEFTHAGVPPEAANLAECERTRRRTEQRAQQVDATASERHEKSAGASTKAEREAELVEERAQEVAAAASERHEESASADTSSVQSVPYLAAAPAAAAAEAADKANKSASAERRAVEAEVASERALSEASDPLAITAKLLAFRQHIEMLEQNAKDKFKKAKDTWQISVVRKRLVPQVLEYFGSPQHVALMWRHTRVIYVGEDGEDAGGLTADLHASFWREVLEPKYGLFERLAEGGAHLPRSDADRDALRRVGRVLLKSILDDHPTGPALSSFVLECICGAHESRAFRNERPRDALCLLATCDSELARRWTALLTTPNDELVAFGLSLNDFDDTLPVEPLSAANVGRAVVAGCRRKLLVDRHDAVVALREGFTLEGRLDLGLQLAQHSNAELSLLLQGKPSLSTVELLECFDWSEPCCAAVTYLMDLLSDAEAFDVARRQLLLRWCTGRDVLPVSGLTNKVTFAAAEMMRGELPDGRRPEACTCFYEMRLPNYSSKEMLRERLEQALAEFAVQGGFGRQ